MFHISIETRRSISPFVPYIYCANTCLLHQYLGTINDKINFYIDLTENAFPTLLIFRPYFQFIAKKLKNIH